VTDLPSVTSRIARDLLATIESELPNLVAIDEERASTPRADGKWSRKQVMGHLVDSAFNNHQRFVRAQLSSSLSFPGYTQDSWVTAQAYQDRSWADILRLWVEVNRHLAHVMSCVPDDVAAREGIAPDGEGRVTLAFLMEDYVGHLRHHVEQIRTRLAA